MMSSSYFMSDFTESATGEMICGARGKFRNISVSYGLEDFGKTDEETTHCSSSWFKATEFYFGYSNFDIFHYEISLNILSVSSSLNPSSSSCFYMLRGLNTVLKPPTWMRGSDCNLIIFAGLSKHNPKGSVFFLSIPIPDPIFWGALMICTIVLVPSLSAIDRTFLILSMFSYYKNTSLPLFDLSRLSIFLTAITTWSRFSCPI